MECVCVCVCVWDGYIWLGTGISGAVYEHYFRKTGVDIEWSPISLSIKKYSAAVSHLATDWLNGWVDESRLVPSVCGGFARPM